MNYMTRYNNEKVKDLVAAARLELDPKKREEMYVDLRKWRKTTSIGSTFTTAHISMLRERISMGFIRIRSAVSFRRHGEELM